jgi:CheY-like chemotaxis protein
MVPQPEGETLVLIVEDEHDNREIMRAVVEDLLGYTALLAADGEEALRFAKDHSPRLVLMDLMMPVLDGFEAIRHLKSAHHTAAIPVIAISALSRPVDRQRALEYGADDYLSKPFDLDLLAGMVERYASGAATPNPRKHNTQATHDWGSGSPGY